MFTLFRKKTSKENYPDDSSPAEPQILFRINESDYLTFEEVLKVHESVAEKRIRLEAYLSTQKEKIELGNVTFIDKRDNNEPYPVYVISVNTSPYFWQMGIADMILSLMLIYDMDHNTENSFKIFMELQKESKKIYIEKSIFVYKKIFKKCLAPGDNYSITRLFSLETREEDRKEYQQLFDIKKEHLLGHHKQIMMRFENEKVLEKGTDEIRESCPEILDL